MRHARAMMWTAIALTGGLLIDTLPLQSRLLADEELVAVVGGQFGVNICVAGAAGAQWNCGVGRTIACTKLCDPCGNALTAVACAAASCWTCNAGPQNAIRECIKTYNPANTCTNWGAPAAACGKQNIAGCLWGGACTCPAVIPPGAGACPRNDCV
jgi:hypothetical protein